MVRYSSSLSLSTPVKFTSCSDRVAWRAVTKARSSSLRADLPAKKAEISEAMVALLVLAVCEMRPVGGREVAIASDIARRTAALPAVPSVTAASPSRRRHTWPPWSGSAAALTAIRAESPSVPAPAATKSPLPAPSSELAGIRSRKRPMRSLAKASTSAVNPGTIPSRIWNSAESEPPSIGPFPVPVGISTRPLWARWSCFSPPSAPLAAVMS